MCEVRHVGYWLVGWAAVGWQVGCVGEGGSIMWYLARPRCATVHVCMYVTPSPQVVRHPRPVLGWRPAETDLNGRFVLRRAAVQCRNMGPAPR